MLPSFLLFFPPQVVNHFEMARKERIDSIWVIMGWCCFRHIVFEAMFECPVWLWERKCVDVFLKSQSPQEAAGFQSHD